MVLTGPGNDRVGNLEHHLWRVIGKRVDGRTDDEVHLAEGAPLIAGLGVITARPSIRPACQRRSPRGLGVQ